MPLLGIPVEFIIFTLMLIGVMLFHKKNLECALAGAICVIGYKLHAGNFELFDHVKHESVLLFNLAGLLLGFAILADYFSKSRVPDLLPKFLPDDWKGGFVLLGLVFVLSGFLDNIAAAMIGGTVASVVFQKRVHIGFLAAIVAASNAGGSGSVIGDTTTTMMWIAGKPALSVLHAYVASSVAFLFFAIIAAKQQDAYQRIVADPSVGIKIDWHSLVIVLLILIGAIIANVWLDFPAIGVWIAILYGASVGKANWQPLQHAYKGTLFLLTLVLTASMMPVDKLPSPSWSMVLGLGFVSSMFDNIPLTKLALDQGGHDWALLAYAVGFGGSMIWFGSSAGVALTNDYPEGKSTWLWIKNGWHVAVSYIIGFFVYLGVCGWNPS